MERYKLLIENIDKDSIEYLVEGKTESEKTYKIRGPFMEAERKNRNGRIYPKHVLEKEVGRYCAEEIAQKLSVGNLGHPEKPTVELKDAAILTETLEWQGNIVMGCAKVLSTPIGQVLKCLMNDGVNVGVSSRALGGLQNGIVSDNLRLLSIDVVQNASSYSSTVVESLVENFDYILQGHSYVAVEVDKFKSELSKNGTRNLANDLHKFLESLKTKL